MCRPKGSGWSVQDEEMRAQILHLREAVVMEVARNRIDPGFERLRGLVAGRCAEIQKSQARRQVEKGHDGLRPDILDALAALILARFLESGVRDSGRGVRSVLPLPAVEEPLGTGELDFPRGPRHGSRSTWRRMALTNPAAEVFFARLTRSTDSPTAACRGSFQVAKLVDSHAQRDAHFDVELPRAAGAMRDEVIELRLVAKCAEDDFGSESGVAGIEFCGLCEQEVGSVAAGIHLAEDVEGDCAGAGDGHSLQSKLSCPLRHCQSRRLQLSDRPRDEFVGFSVLQWRTLSSTPARCTARTNSESGSLKMS